MIQDIAPHKLNNQYDPLAVPEREEVNLFFQLIIKSSLLLHGLGDVLQVLDSVVNDLNLLLHHGHTPGEVVMLPDFPGQLVQLGFRDSLRLAVGDQNSKKSYAAGDYRCDNAFHCSTFLYTLY